MGTIIMRINLEKKQISLISMIIIAFLLLGWQIYKLVSDDIVTSNSNNTALADNTAAADAMPNHDRQLPIKNSVAAPKLVRSLPPVLVSQQNALITNQAQYMELVSQFEMAKIQHKLLSQEVAIAMAKQQISEIQAKIKSDLRQNNNEVFNSTDNSHDDTAQYQLAYLDHQNNTWNATVVINGHYENANKGDLLTDGGTVVNVSSDGVLIDKNQQAYEVTFNGTIAHTLKQRAVQITQNSPTNKVTQAMKPVAIKPASSPANAPLLSSQHAVLFHTDATPVSKVTAKPKSILFNLPADKFTIHIKEAADKTSLDHIIDVYHLGKNAFIYQENKNGSPVYVLIYNTYPTSFAAESALSHLPEALQNQDVWIEQVGMLQQVVS